MNHCRNVKGAKGVMH